MNVEGSNPFTRSSLLCPVPSLEPGFFLWSLQGTMAAGPRGCDWKWRTRRRKQRGVVLRVAAAHFGALPMPPTRGGVTDGRQPVPTLVGRVHAAARPHRSCGPLPPTRGEVTDGRQPVPTLLGRVRAAARPHLVCGSRSGTSRLGRSCRPARTRILEGRARTQRRDLARPPSHSRRPPRTRLPGSSLNPPLRTATFDHTRSATSPCRDPGRGLSFAA